MSENEFEQQLRSRLARAALAVSASSDAAEVGMSVAPSEGDVRKGRGRLVAGSIGAAAVIALFVLLVGARSDGPVRVDADLAHAADSPPVATSSLSAPVDIDDFSNEDALLIFDDGISGVVIVNIDKRVAVRAPIGNSVGDAPFRLWRVEGSLVAGSDPVSVAEVGDLRPLAISDATYFLPSVEDARIWTITYDSGRIDGGAFDYALVELDGSVVEAGVVNEPDGIAAAGYLNGLVLETPTGLLLYPTEDGAPISLGTQSPGIAGPAYGDKFVWCELPCQSLQVTNTSTVTEVGAVLGATDTWFEPRSARFSPNGALVAAVVLDQATNKALEIVIIEVETAQIIHRSLVATSGLDALSISWSSNETVYFSSQSWGEPSTLVGRLHVSGDVQLANLPFGSLLEGFAVDPDLVNVPFDEPIALEDCTVGKACSFEF